MKRTIKYDNRAILQQAQIYTDPYRVPMEFIDNSIDSAESFWLADTNRYSKDIIITITFVKAAGQKLISVADNCAGIRLNPSEPLIIFGSEKKNDPSTNGMFGMGMFSYLSIADRMKVETTSTGITEKYLYEITPDIFITNQAPEIEINCSPSSAEETGTVVSISDFRENFFEELNPHQLKEEIEAHFELLLHRNLTIEIIPDGRK